MKCSWKRMEKACIPPKVVIYCDFVIQPPLLHLSSSHSHSTNLTKHLHEPIAKQVKKAALLLTSCSLLWRHSLMFPTDLGLTVPTDDETVMSLLSLVPHLLAKLMGLSYTYAQLTDSLYIVKTNYRHIMTSHSQCGNAPVIFRYFHKQLKFVTFVNSTHTKLRSTVLVIIWLAGF